MLVLQIELRWNVCNFVPHNIHNDAQRLLRDSILETFMPETYAVISRTRDSDREGQSPQDFYEAAFVPDAEDSETLSMQVPRLTAKLYPFQKRAVQWLLGREGVQWTQTAGEDGPGVMPAVHGKGNTAHFVPSTDANGSPIHISSLFGIVTRDLADFEAKDAELKGGILAEEMGLGKTLEIISLILLNPRAPGREKVWDPYLATEVRKTGATLIVTPPSLKHQWISELERHAPHLRVMAYHGIGQSCKDEESQQELVEKLGSHDVVVTTYAELQKELHFALDPPARAMRNERRHHRPKSPLVQLSWWRVCLDEAQEIESGVSNAATLARIIPRENAWGVTGTPVKDGVKDLWGLLLFLRYEPYASAFRVWESLVEGHQETFSKLFNRITLRHTKRLVRHELELPRQKRYVITMPFTAVEEQHYQSLFKDLAEECGLDSQGAPLQADWDPDDSAVLEAMRTALDRLRQTALHPEVGGRNRRALGHRNGPMRTVAEVLDAMIEHSENAVTTEHRALLLSKLTRGQLLENSPRVREALFIWEDVLRESEELVRESRDQLRIELERAKTSEAEVVGSSRISEGDEDPEAVVSPRVGEAQRKVRYALEIQHRAVFFCANAHFQIKSNGDMTEPDSEAFREEERLETAGYEKAKVIRREILQETHAKATNWMKRLASRASEQAFAEIPAIEVAKNKGLESRRHVDVVEVLGEALNEQADVMDEWREVIIQLLLKELLDEDDDIELTGDEYGETTKVQEDLAAYVTVLRAVIADRQAVLSGQTLSKLSEDELKRAVNLAEDGDGPSPQKLLQLAQIRENIKPAKELGSWRSAITDLRDLTTRLRFQADHGNNRAKAEIDIASESLKYLQSQLSDQLKAITALEQEIDKFTTAMNARVEYYRQLQAVSDQVDVYQGPRTIADMDLMLRDESVLANRLDSSRAKHRYLVHLKRTDSKEEQQLCIICQETFSIGVLTVCGHQFCKECLTLWFKAHHNCPVCKRKLKSTNLHDITLKPQELKVHTEHAEQQETVDSQGAPVSKKTAIYMSVSNEQLAEIKNIDLPGDSFTTKVDTLVRHLMWLRQSDPGAKSIIFSQ
jgi:E3 ubiquitin-protein ligase SHPRH